MEAWDLRRPGAAAQASGRPGRSVVAVIVPQAEPQHPQGVHSGSGLLALSYRISRDTIHKHIKRAGCLADEGQCHVHDKRRVHGPKCNFECLGHNADVLAAS